MLEIRDEDGEGGGHDRGVPVFVQMRVGWRGDFDSVRWFGVLRSTMRTSGCFLASPLRPRENASGVRGILRSLGASWSVRSLLVRLVGRLVRLLGQERGLAEHFAHWLSRPLLPPRAGSATRDIAKRPSSSCLSDGLLCMCFFFASIVC